MNRMQKTLSAIEEQITNMTSEPGDLCLIRQHEEQLLEVKKEVSEVSSTLLSLDLES